MHFRILTSEKSSTICIKVIAVNRDKTDFQIFHFQFLSYKAPKTAAASSSFSLLTFLWYHFSENHKKNQKQNKKKPHNQPKSWILHMVIPVLRLFLQKDRFSPVYLSHYPHLWNIIQSQTSQEIPSLLQVKTWNSNAELAKRPSALLAKFKHLFQSTTSRSLIRWKWWFRNPNFLRYSWCCCKNTSSVGHTDVSNPTTKWVTFFFSSKRILLNWSVTLNWETRV